MESLSLLLWPETMLRYKTGHPLPRSLWEVLADGTYDGYGAIFLWKKNMFNSHHHRNSKFKKFRFFC